MQDKMEETILALKQAMKELQKHKESNLFFNLHWFTDNFGSLFSTSQQVTDENLDQANKFINQLRPLGEFHSSRFCFSTTRILSSVVSFSFSLFFFFSFHFTFFNFLFVVSFSLFFFSFLSLFPVFFLFFFVFSISFFHFFNFLFVVSFLFLCFFLFFSFTFFFSLFLSCFCHFSIFLIFFKRRN